MIGIKKIHTDDVWDAVDLTKDAMDGYDRLKDGHISKADEDFFVEKTQQTIKSQPEYKRLFAYSSA